MDKLLTDEQIDRDMFFLPIITQAMARPFVVGYRDLYEDDRARLVAQVAQLEAKVARLTAELMAADDEMLAREAAGNE